MNKIISFGEILSLGIAGFSKLNNIEQINSINILNKILISYNLSKYNQIIPNGDGFHIIFKDNFKAFILALFLKEKEYLIKQVIPMFEGVRISVHKGEYFPFINMLGNKEYMGKGIVETEELSSMKKMFWKNSVLINVECIDFNSSANFVYSKDIHDITFKKTHSKIKVINISNN